MRFVPSLSLLEIELTLHVQYLAAVKDHQVQDDSKDVCFVKVFVCIVMNVLLVHYKDNQLGKLVHKNKHCKEVVLRKSCVVQLWSNKVLV